MIWMYLTKAWGLVKSVPREVWYALAAALLLWFVYGQGKDAGYDKRDAEYAEAARIAAERAREADAVAGGVVDQERSDTEESNDAAREAATGSDDPLGAALDSLRGT